jgi:hypothetical protein
MNDNIINDHIIDTFINDYIIGNNNSSTTDNIMDTSISNYIIDQKYYGLETIPEDISLYINYNDDENILSMTTQDIVNNILKLSIINTASLLSFICNNSENIEKMNQILLQLPITAVCLIIPTMIILTPDITPNIVSILLNMSIPVTALIIANINIPHVIVYPKYITRSSILYLIKSELISNMSIENAAVILSDSNMPIRQVEIILSNMSKEKSSLILSKMF